MGLLCVSLIATCVEHRQTSYLPFVLLLQSSVCQILCQFLVGLFYILELKEFFLSPGYKSLITYVFWKYLLPICGLPFHFLNSVFQRAELLYFSEVLPFNFSLWWLIPFMSYVWNLCLSQGPTDFLLCVLWKLLHIKFHIRSVILFSWFFCIGCEVL